MGGTVAQPPLPRVTAQNEARKTPRITLPQELDNEFFRVLRCGVGGCNWIVRPGRDSLPPRDGIDTRAPAAAPPSGAGRDPGRDGAGDARPSVPAVAVRDLGQILLVIVLGEVEFGRGQDLGRDGAEACRPEPRLVVGLRSLGGRALRLGERVDARPVLRADVIALAQALRRVVALPERLEEHAVAHELRVEDDEDGLVVPGAAGAYFLVGRIGGQARRIAARRDPNSFAKLPERPLRPPEAAEAEHRPLAAGGIRPLERPAEEIVLLRRCDGYGPARERGLGGGHRELRSRTRHGVTSEVEDSPSYTRRRCARCRPVRSNIREKPEKACAKVRARYGSIWSGVEP